MLLPKRVKRNMLKRGENPTEVLLRKLISLQFPDDFTVLDSENAIVIFRDEGNSILIHERLHEGEILEISKSITLNYDYTVDKINFIQQLSLLKKANHKENYNFNYKYKNGIYIMQNEVFDNITFKVKNNLLEKNKCALGMFQITSTKEDDDYSFISPITGEKITESFEVNDGNYYAILNFDGTIRDNKLFKGTSFAKPEEIISLDNYETLDEFKKERIALCNQIKNRNRKYYMEMLKEKNSCSPYIDEEIIRILKR